MKFVLVTKLDKRKTRTPKIGELYHVIFSIYGQLEAIWRLVYKSMVCKTLTFVNNNLLSNKKYERGTKKKHNSHTNTLSRATVLPENADFSLKNTDLIKSKKVLPLKCAFLKPNMCVCIRTKFQGYKLQCIFNKYKVDGSCFVSPPSPSSPFSSPTTNQKSISEKFHPGYIYIYKIYIYISIYIYYIYIYIDR